MTRKGTYNVKFSTEKLTKVGKLTSGQVGKLRSWLYAEVGCSFSPHVIRNVVKRLEDYAFFTKFATICAQLHKGSTLYARHMSRHDRR